MTIHTHEQAIDALCGCAATVSVLSYQEAIEGYFKLRGLSIPSDQTATPTTTVPTEPTEAMRVAGVQAWPDADDTPPITAIYRAMIAAAPVPSPHGKEVREAVARVIDPWPFGIYANLNATERAADMRSDAYAKADAILALLTPARSGT